MRLPHLIEREVTPVHFAAGETVFAEGDPGDLMYVIQQGEVDLMVDQRLLETVTAEGFFGEMALIDGGPRSATAIARIDCALVPIDLRRFTFMVQETPFFAIQIMRVMSARLRRGNRPIAEGGDQTTASNADQGESSRS
jgi:CRP/FNR family cyclic AMP-dependent transcriptional regulator